MYKMCTRRPEWIKLQATLAGAAHVKRIEGKFGKPKDIPLVDHDGRGVGNLGHAIKQLFPVLPGPLARTRKSVIFDPPLFCPTAPDSPIPQMRLLGIEADVWTTRVEAIAELEFEGTVDWLLKDIISGTAVTLDAKGTALRVDSETHVNATQWIEDPNL
ncbi:MAG: hypothetical protein ABR562_07565 [Thermoplasmatota archaeon]